MKNLELALETLEDRILLSGTVFTLGANLVVEGTAIGDTIDVRQVGSNLRVMINDFDHGQFAMPTNTIIVRSFAGADEITFQAGITVDAVVDGGIGSDTIRTGAGNDTIIADDGNDRVWGRAGDDEIFGNRGDDILIGQAGNDTIVAGDSSSAETNFISGGTGDDTLTGGRGDDTINGGPGADNILDLASNTQTGFLNVIHGGSGNDVIEARALARNMVCLLYTSPSPRDRG